MIGKLETLLVAAIGVGAIGVVWAAPVQAHTPAKFHCDVEPCTITTEMDGTGSTAHHVFKLGNQTVTCEKLEHTATVNAKTFEKFSTDGQYKNCKYLAQPMTFDMNECGFEFHAEGEIEIVCPEGEEITGEVSEISCHIAIPAQKPTGGRTYHNITVGGIKRVTSSVSAGNMKATVTGSECVDPGEFSDASMTTGNVILTAEKDNTKKELVNFSYTPTVP